MSKTVSNGKLFRVTVVLNDRLLDAMKQFPDLAASAFEDALTWWHEKVLPEHFKKEASDRYGYALRSKNYRKSKHGLPDLISPAWSGHSGSLDRDLKASYELSRTGSGTSMTIALKMHARVLNFAGVEGEDNQNLYVQHSRRSGNATYPNLKREIKILTDEEHDAFADMVKARLVYFFGEAQGAAATDESI